MKPSLIALLPLLIAQSVEKPVKSEEQKQPFSLKLDQETYLTDTFGVANPNTIITSKPGDTVRIYFTDGTYFTAIVKETTMHEQGIFKVFGEMTSPTNTGFGFVLTKDGTFAGAIVQRSQNIVHQLLFDETMKGYVFKYVKPPKVGS